MASFSQGTIRAQEQRHGARATGDTWYVDSATGSDGNNGESKRHPFKTLTRALVKALAGDRIVLVPGGSETITTGLEVTVEDLEIICECAHPESGFTISGAGTLDLLTLSAADCRVSGLQLTHTGATSDAAGILVGAAAHRSVIECRYNATAVTTPAGFGIEVTSGADDVKISQCEILDALYGVYQKEAAAAESDRLEIVDCLIHVGLSTAFGVYVPVATGKSQGLRVLRCHFVEANGDGSAATAAWDGTNGANASQGPIKIGAACDQYLFAECYASTALSTSFANAIYVTSGAAGGIVQCVTGASSIDIVDAWDRRAVSAAAIALTAGTVLDVFTVANGPIELLALVMHVTAAVSADACTAKWVLDPTVGIDTDISGTVDIISAAAGDVFYVTGASAAAMVKAATGTAIPLGCTTPPIVMPGGIDLTLGNSNPTTGAATAYLVYRPLSSTATVT